MIINTHMDNPFKKFKSNEYYNNNETVEPFIKCVFDEFEVILFKELSDYKIYSCENNDPLDGRLNSIAEFNISKYLLENFNQLNQSLTTITPSIINLLSHINHISEFNKKLTGSTINIKHVYILVLTMLGLENYELVETIHTFYKAICENNNNYYNQYQSLINDIKSILNNSTFSVYNNISSEQSLILKYNYINHPNIKSSPTSFNDHLDEEVEEEEQTEPESSDEEVEIVEPNEDEDEDLREVYYSHFEQYNEIKSKKNNNSNTDNHIIKVYNQNETALLNYQKNSALEWCCDSQLFNSISLPHQDVTNMFNVVEPPKHSSLLSTIGSGNLTLKFKQHVGILYSKLDDYRHREIYKFSDDEESEIDEESDTNDSDSYNDDNENEIHIPIPPIQQPTTNITSTYSNKDQENKNSNGYSINPSLSLFKKCFSIYSHGIFDTNFNWGYDYDADGHADNIQVVVTGSSITACIDNLPIEIKKAFIWLIHVERIFYKSRLPKFFLSTLMKHIEQVSLFKQLVYSRYHSPLSPYYNNHNIELSLIRNSGSSGDGESMVKNKISSIIKQLSTNLNIGGDGGDEEYTYIRTSDSIIIYYKHPHHSIVVQLQVYQSIKDLISISSIDKLNCLNVVYDGNNVYMSKSSIYSFNSKCNLITSLHFEKQENKPIETYFGFKSIKWDYNPNNLNCNYKHKEETTRNFNYNIQDFDKDSSKLLINCTPTHKIPYVFAEIPINAADGEHVYKRYHYHMSNERRSIAKKLLNFRPLPNWKQSIKLIKRLKAYHSIDYSMDQDKIVLKSCLIQHEEMVSFENLGFTIKSNCLICKIGTVHFRGGFTYWCNTCLNKQQTYNKLFKSKNVIIILNNDGDDGIEETDYNLFGIRISLELLSLGFNVTIVTTSKQETVYEYYENQVSDGYEITYKDLKRLKIISPQPVDQPIETNLIEHLTRKTISTIPNISILINSVYGCDVGNQLFSNLSNHISNNKINLSHNDNDEIKFSNYSITYDINNQDETNYHSLKVYTGNGSFNQYKVFNNRYSNGDNLQYEIKRQGCIIFKNNTLLPIIDSAIYTINQILNHFIINSKETK